MTLVESVKLDLSPELFKRVDRFLDFLDRLCPLPPVTVLLHLTNVHDLPSVPLKVSPTMSDLKDNQTGTYTLTFLDAKGNATAPPPAALPLTWVVDNTALVTLTPAPDSLSCVVAAVGPLGAAVVTVNSADNSFTGSDDLTIGASAPKSISVSLGNVVDVP